MGYIEDYFGKEPQEVNSGDIDDFVKRRLEECITLDYKVRAGVKSFLLTIETYRIGPGKFRNPQSPIPTYRIW